MVQIKTILDRYTPSQILVIGFALLIIVGTILLSLPISSASGNPTGLLTCFFTSTSAVCVTGLVVVDTGTYWSLFGKTIILLLIQAGGLGFMTVTSFLALLIGRKITLRERLLIQESLNKLNIQGTVKFVKYVLFTTLAIEGIGAILFSIKFIPIFDVKTGIAFSIFHSISAFCNAGFDIMGNYSSLTAFTENVTVQLTAMMLVLLGGLGFSVIYEIIQKRRLRNLSLHSSLVLRMTLGLVLLGFVLIFIFEYHNMANFTLKEKILNSLFHAITPRTAGFNTLAMDKLTSGTLMVTMIFMFIGGSSGSTAGGVKITTIGVICLKNWSVIKGKQDTEYRKKRIANEIIDRAIVIVGVATLWVAFVMLVLSVTEDCRFIELLFETISACGTVGLSMGITSKLSIMGRIIIAISMFIGRLGPLTVALALASRQKKQKVNVRYPEDKLIVG